MESVAVLPSYSFPAGPSRQWRCIVLNYNLESCCVNAARGELRSIAGQAKAFATSEAASQQCAGALLASAPWEKSAAADVLEEFTRYHHDWPQAPRISENIVELRK
jgi:hypothetical protein